MRINNVTEFYNFLQAYQLIGMSSQFENLRSCISDFNSTCSCKKNEKNRKFDMCNNMYKSIVSNTLPYIKPQLFSKLNESKIEFYYNSTFLISTISR